ncbi:MAG: SGNH/GDSL hydrolase family protein [Planctomycetaceae bacterium]
MPKYCLPLLLTICLCLLLLGFQGQISAQEPSTVRIVVLGDSITKGVRTGVAAEEIYQHLLQTNLSMKEKPVVVLNEGIGGERTDQAFKRLQKSVIDRKPHLVTIMYGTNDSYVDPGKTESRISANEYGANLESLVKQLQAEDIQVVLMTEPRWGQKARNGLGESPNDRLELFMEECRKVAEKLEVPLVDNYVYWQQAEADGANLSDWTTDECHPNAAGHEQITKAMLPVLKPLVAEIN